MLLKRTWFVPALLALSLAAFACGEARAVDGTWYPITGNGPSARKSPAGCYDSQGKRMIIFGGEDATGLKNDVWALSLGTSCPQWTQLFPTGTAPQPRDEHRMIYDPVGNRVILFGGEIAKLDHSCLVPDSVIGDVWQLSLGGTPAWAQLTTTGAPCPRGGHTAVYNSSTKAMEVHAGEILATTGCGTFYTNDSYFLNLSSMSWGSYSCAEYASNCIPGCAPNPYGLHCGGTCPGWIGARWYHAAIYDPVGARMVVHGGTYDPNSPDNQTWVLPDGGSWSQLSPTGSPVRQNHRGEYDSARQRMLIFGGDDGVTYYSSVYALAMASPTAWTQLSTSGGPPSARSFSAIVYDPDNDRLVVFGGEDGTMKYGDTWQLRFSDSPPATTTGLGITSVKTGPNTVVLKWSAPTDDASGGCTAASYTFRMRSGGPITESNWSTSSMVPGASGPSTPGAQDTIKISSGLASGVWWYFALKTTDAGGNTSAVSNNDCIKFGTPIQWCGGGSGMIAEEEGGPTPELAIVSLRPNPALKGVAEIFFSLADESPGELKVFDVAGRLVESHELTHLGPGAHGVTIGGRTKLSPGLYRVRISQSGRSATRSVIVVP